MIPPDSPDHFPAGNQNNCMSEGLSINTSKMLYISAIIAMITGYTCDTLLPIRTPFLLESGMSVERYI